MIKLEDHVTSLGLSKKLKELGVAKDSLFYWAIHDEKSDKKEKLFYADSLFKYLDLEIESVSAFTTSELMLFIPNIAFEIFISKRRNGDDFLSFIRFDADNHEESFIIPIRSTQENALAELIVVLIERKIIVI